MKDTLWRVWARVQWPLAILMLTYGALVVWKTNALFEEQNAEETAAAILSVQKNPEAKVDTVVIDGKEYKIVDFVPPIGMVRMEKVENGIKVIYYDYPRK